MSLHLNSAIQANFSLGMKCMTISNKMRMILNFSLNSVFAEKQLWLWHFQHNAGAQHFFPTHLLIAAPLRASISASLQWAPISYQYHSDHKLKNALLTLWKPVGWAISGYTSIQVLHMAKTLESFILVSERIPSLLLAVYLPPSPPLPLPTPPPPRAFWTVITVHCSGIAMETILVFKSEALKFVMFCYF